MATQLPLFALEPSPRAGYLQAAKHIKRMRGGSQSQLIRASDGNYWVTKFVNNPQHTRILANEFLASRLGQCLRLPIPDVDMIEVSEWLIGQTPDLSIQLPGHTVPFCSGLHLASRFAGNSEWEEGLSYLPESQFANLVNRLDFARVLALDKWTSNADGRQAVFTKLAYNTGYAALFIDQGYAFNAGEWEFSDLPLHGIYYLNYVYEEVTSWASFEPALTLAEEMDSQTIWECAAPIPSEWCAPDAGALGKLVDTLHKRRSKIRDLITAFRNSSRRPFPNWASS